MSRWCCTIQVRLCRPRQVAVIAVSVSLLCAVVRPGVAQQQPCVLAAQVVGDAHLVQPIRLELDRLDVREQPVSWACPFARATVTERRGAIAITLRDSNGRQVERVVSESRVAAMWIESQLRSDIGASLLHMPSSLSGRAQSPRLTELWPPGAAGPTRAAETPGDASHPVAQRRGSGEPLSGAVLVETQNADDESSWRSVYLSVDRGFDVARIGLSARYGVNSRFF